MIDFSPLAAYTIPLDAIGAVSKGGGFPATSRAIRQDEELEGYK